MDHRVEAALALATLAHAGQTRKYSVVITPYITHPIAVAKYVRELGGDENVVIAALLHDAIEDTDVTLDRIATDFGDDVAQLVDAVTRRDDEPYFDFIQRSIDAGERVRLIKVADIVHNASTLPIGHTLHERYTRALAMINAAQLADGARSAT